MKEILLRIYKRIPGTWQNNRSSGCTFRGKHVCKVVYNIRNNRVNLCLGT